MIEINKFIYILFLIGVFLSPFTMFLPLGVNITIYDIVLILTFGLTLITISLSTRTSVKIKITYTITFLSLFIFGSLISSFNIESISTSTIIMLQYLFAIVTQIVVMKHIFKNAKNTHLVIFKIMDAIFFSTLLILIINLLAIIGVLPNSTSFFSSNHRLESVMGNANIHAKHLVMILPFILIYIELKKRVLLAYISLVLTILSLFMTASFGGLLYAFLTLLYFYAVKMLFVSKPIKLINSSIHISKKILNFRSVVLFIFMISVVVYIYSNPPEVFVNRVLSADDLSEAGSANLKINLMLEAINFILNDNFIFGAGLGEYLNISNYFTNVHNLFLLVFVETGIFGFIGLIGFLLYIFFFSFKMIRKSEGINKYIFLGLNTSVFAFFMNAMTSTHQYSTTTWFFLILALCFSKEFKKRKEEGG